MRRRRYRGASSDEDGVRNGRAPLAAASALPGRSRSRAAWLTSPCPALSSGPTAASIASRARRRRWRRVRSRADRSRRTQQQGPAAEHEQTAIGRCLAHGSDERRQRIHVALGTDRKPDQLEAAAADQRQQEAGASGTSVADLPPGSAEELAHHGQSERCCSPGAGANRAECTGRPRAAVGTADPGDAAQQPLQAPEPDRDLGEVALVRSPLSLQPAPPAPADPAQRSDGDARRASC